MTGEKLRMASNGLLLTFALCIASLVSAGNAHGARAQAQWAIHAISTPSRFTVADNGLCISEGKCDSYQITLRNAGAVASNGGEGGVITLSAIVPTGLSVHKLSLFWASLDTQLGIELNLAGFICTETPVTGGVMVQCKLSAQALPFIPSLPPDDSLELSIGVTVDEPEPAAGVTLPFEAKAIGEGLVEAATSIETRFGSGPLPFGVDGFSFSINGPDGLPDSTAGSHPYEVVTRLDLTNEFRLGPDTGGEKSDTGVEDVKDVVTDLPLGMVGDALAAPRCTFAELSSQISGGTGGCPADTVVGHLRTEPLKNDSANSSIYNMVPERGVAAEFAFVDSIAGTHVIYAKVVPTSAGYVLRAFSPDIPEISLSDLTVELYGDPAARNGGGGAEGAMFTNPSSCTGQPLVTTVHIDSWQHPGRMSAAGDPDFSDPRWVGVQSSAPPVNECNNLAFRPSQFSIMPEASATDSATGLNLDLQIPAGEEPDTLATPPLKHANVALPPGLIPNPAVAGGLAGCSASQIGWLGGTSNNFTPDPPTCPDASKIAGVEATSPLISSVLQGSLYLASQNENPFGTVLAGYLVIDDPTTGVIVKVPQKLLLDPGTGQVTGVLDESPQLPLSDVKLKFFGGDRGELVTPESCGTFSTTSALTPWSAPDSGPDAVLTSAFSINQGCAPSFAPLFTAGVTNPQAGAYSPFTLSFSRTDQEQELAGLTVALPRGVSAKLAGVSECSDSALSRAAGRTGAAEVANPSCPAAAKVGTVEAGAGAGSEPFFLPGNAYLTGPYKGAPYGLAVVVPAVAGPFDLGTVVIRQALYIDSDDGHVTDVSDPFPTILDVTGADGHTDGFPIRLRRVDVTIDRAAFTLNPTNCSVSAVSATFTSTLGATASTSSRFAVGGCRELGFRPKFSVSAAAATSRSTGAAIKVTVSTTPGQANFAKARVSLPRQLPSRLATLHGACPEVVFAGNPASCPSASVVGTAKAVLPILSQPLMGPAYLVSHGGAAFPNLVAVLQGNGITVRLTGKTDIKKGITTSTFEAIPDAPVSRFELSLPAGPHSILGAFLPTSAHGRLCGQKLVMPTILTGQNGAVINQSTAIKVAGCRKTSKTKLKGKKASHKHSGAHRRMRK